MSAAAGFEFVQSGARYLSQTRAHAPDRYVCVGVTRLKYAPLHTRDADVEVVYAGSREGLISLGCITAAMLDGIRKGVQSRDESRDGYRVERFKGWLRVTRWKPEARARALPCVALLLTPRVAIEEPEAAMPRAYALDVHRRPPGVTLH